jgi:hypothetical protein
MVPVNEQLLVVDGRNEFFTLNFRARSNRISALFVPTSLPEYISLFPFYNFINAFFPVCSARLAINERQAAE